MRLLAVWLSTLLGSAGLLLAETFLVDTTAVDLGDFPWGDGKCQWSTIPPEGQRCTLRAAVQEANALAGHDVIIIPEGWRIVLDKAGVGEDSAISGDLDITDNVTIASIPIFGVKPVIDGGGIDRVFDVRNDHLTLQDVVVTGGFMPPVADASQICSGGRGGGIFVGPFGTLSVLGSEVVANRAAWGGGIYISSPDPGIIAPTHEIVGSTLDGNRSEPLGVTCTNRDFRGAAVATLGDLQIVDSSVVNHYADSAVPTVIWSSRVGLLLKGSTIAGNLKQVGSIPHTGFERNVLLTDVNLEVQNSTLSDNGGSAITLDYELPTREAIIQHTTIASNSLIGITYGADSGDLLRVKHSIIAGNLLDCNLDEGGGLEIAGRANLDSDGSCGLGAGDLPNTDPLLGPLLDNGGPTQTQVPMTPASGPQSPAVDFSLTCSLPNDQRLASRPLNGKGLGFSLCDIGAVEVLPCDTASNQVVVSAALGNGETVACDEIITSGTAEVLAGATHTFRSRRSSVFQNGFRVSENAIFRVLRDPEAGSSVSLP